MCHCHQKKQTHPTPLTACFHPHLCASTNVCAANWSSSKRTLPCLPLPQVSSTLSPAHHTAIQVFACTKEEAAEQGGSKQDHVFQWWSWSVPAVCQCKAGAVGRRLESCNTNLVCHSCLSSGIPALHSHSHWQPCSCLVSRFRVPSQLNTNSIKKKKKKKQLLIFSQCRFLNQFPVQSLPAKGRKRRKDAEKGGGPTFYRLGCCGNTQTPHFKFQLASTAECDYFNQFFPKIKPYSNLCRNLSSHSLLGHKKQEVRPVHFINHIHPSYSIKQRALVSLT